MKQKIFSIIALSITILAMHTMQGAAEPNCAYILPVYQDPDYATTMIISEGNTIEEIKANIPRINHPAYGKIKMKKPKQDFDLIAGYGDDAKLITPENLNAHLNYAIPGIYLWPHAWGNFVPGVNDFETKKQELGETRVDSLHVLFKTERRQP